MRPSKTTALLLHHPPHLTAQQWKNDNCAEKWEHNIVFCSPHKIMHYPKHQWQTSCILLMCSCGGDGYNSLSAVSNTFYKAWKSISHPSYLSPATVASSWSNIMFNECHLMHSRPAFGQGCIKKSRHEHFFCKKSLGCPDIICSTL